MSKSRSTTDHAEIRRWVEQRNGKPAAAIATQRKSAPGMLRIDFSGRAEEEILEPISWDEWFSKFEENKLAALYHDDRAEENANRFFRLISRNG